MRERLNPDHMVEVAKSHLRGFEAEYDGEFTVEAAFPRNGSAYIHIGAPGVAMERSRLAREGSKWVQIPGFRTTFFPLELAGSLILLPRAQGRGINFVATPDQASAIALSSIAKVYRYQGAPTGPNYPNPFTMTQDAYRRFAVANQRA